MKWIKKLFAPAEQPPWVAPRMISQQGNPDDYQALKARLDAAWRDGREIVYKDRVSGLYWNGVAMDYGHAGAADEHLVPLEGAPPGDRSLREDFDDDYVARAITHGHLWKIGGWCFKVYRIIGGSGGLSEDEHFLAARETAEKLLVEANATAHFNNGFAILNYGADQVGLHINWWTEGGVCTSKRYTAPQNGQAIFKSVEGPQITSVWELVVIDFERRAWVDTILKRTGSLSVYHQTWLPPTNY